MFRGLSQGRRRYCKKDEDHISNLPDTILCHILSFLTTTSAVKTSILSKRWKYVWTKVPALDFTGVINVIVTRYQRLPLEQKICFKNFMDKVLLHNIASYVNRFRLNFLDVEPFYCNSWLIAASRREIHELDVVLDQYLYLPRSFVSSEKVCLPPRFLSSEKLVVLKLEGFISISASVSFHLPNLETIHLRRFESPDDEFMKKLSSSCPVLRELHIDGCRVKATTLCVESLSLRSLSIKATTSIQNTEQACIVVIKAPNLTYLKLDEYQVSLDIGNMSSLIEADLGLGVTALNHIEKLLTTVSGVKTLRITSQDFSKSKKLPVFPNLTWLEHKPDQLLSMPLYSAPKLKSLVLQYYDCDVDSIFDPKFAPEHMPGLESVIIHNFYGHVKEFDMVAYFLKAASALKEMKINLHHAVTYKITTAVSVCRELLDFPRSSAVCRVKITTPYLCSGDGH